ncbi:hypothetical protein [Arsenicicoccus bolidensis]|uniref:Integrase n=1 Tax=Arsenicicoccus bolidensis TaxID=229480 RepID=A0ABS9Q161_9MICO|nr:hypothetical protein [Arsenicicoccus bolidensis]MCG7321617.1 hypothetical protein [Arsenicicoccus bolidensis]
MLDHASAAMTLDVYAELFPDDLDAVGRSLNALVPSQGVPQMCHNGPSAALDVLAIDPKRGL